MTISGKAKLAGVMGWPVSHSRSPLLHNHWISTLGLEAAYVPLPVKPENFEAALRALPKLGFVGANVTVPHKEAAFGLCDKLDDAAKRIRAVNTLVVRDDGTIEGRNTDAIGFAESIRHVADDEAKGSVALVLGAGGASRAIVAALIDLGVEEIRIANRTVAKAQTIADSMRKDDVVIRAVPWENRDDELDGASILVNTTTCGMKGHDELEIDLLPLGRGAIVADIVYTPLETKLIASARELGLITAGGLRMLVEQARPAFDAWFGTKPDITKEVMEMLETDVKAESK